MMIMTMLFKKKIKKITSVFYSKGLNISLNK